MSELRWNPLLGEWVITATHRQDRTFLPPKDFCPLCPTRPGGPPTEISRGDFDVVVFDNRFPSLQADPPAPAVNGTGLTPVAPAAGACEVVVYTPRHEGSLRDAPLGKLRRLIAVWADRTTQLAHRSDVDYVFVFENKGEVIGVTLAHPHGQIYAYPFVPPRLERMLVAAQRHRDAADGACLACELLAKELREGRRILVAGSAAVAYVPQAARWPYEVHVVPRRHVGQLADLETTELAEMVRLHADALARLDQLFEREVPAMSGWFASPTRTADAPLHLRLEVVSPQRDAGKLKYLAGSESLMGAFIGDVAPEDAAERLRSVPGRGA